MLQVSCDRVYCVSTFSKGTRHLNCLSCVLLQFGYKMLVDYSETQDEMDKLAFTLDRNKFSRSSSFSGGQSTESDLRPQVSKTESNRQSSIILSCITDGIAFSTLHMRSLSS